MKPPRGSHGLRTTYTDFELCSLPRKDLDAWPQGLLGRPDLAYFPSPLYFLSPARALSWLFLVPKDTPVRSNQTWRSLPQSLPTKAGSGKTHNLSVALASSPVSTATSDPSACPQPLEQLQVVENGCFRSFAGGD